jgi:hypothetical protein
LKQSQVVLHDKGQVACGHRRPLAFRRLTAILVPLSEDAIALILRDLPSRGGTVITVPR